MVQYMVCIKNDTFNFVAMTVTMTVCICIAAAVKQTIFMVCMPMTDALFASMVLWLSIGLCVHQCCLSLSVCLSVCLFASWLVSVNLSDCLL